VRRLFFALLFANVMYFGWALWVTPPPTVPPNETLARLPHMKLVDELPPDQRPDPNAPKPAPTGALQSCLSIGPFADVNLSAQAAAILKEQGFDPKQRAAQGEMGEGFWVFIANLPTEADSDRMLASLEHNGIKDALVMPASADAGRRISLGLFTERARAERRAEAVRAMGLKAEVAERKLPSTVYWVDLAPQPGMTTVPLQALFAQGVSTKVSVQTCPAAASAISAQASAGSISASGAGANQASPPAGPPKLP
jgi:hypothetical protein